jgi:hypothetical protein
MEVHRSEHLRKNITGVCLMAAPLVLVIGQLIHPVDKTDGAAELRVVVDNLDRWYAAHIIELVAIALMIPAVLGLAHLIHERRPTAAYAGGALSLLGLVAVAAVTGTEGLGGYFVAKADPDSPGSVAFFESMLEGGRLLPLYLVTLLLGIGLIVTAVGLYRSRVVAPWSAVAIGLGSLLIDLGFPAGVPALVWAGMLLLLAGMAPIGYSVLTGSDSAWEHTPDFAGFRPPAPTAT